MLPRVIIDGNFVTLSSLQATCWNAEKTKHIITECTALYMAFVVLLKTLKIKLKYTSREKHCISNYINGSSRKI